jgi:hypothetical protein
LEEFLADAFPSPTAQVSSSFRGGFGPQPAGKGG